MDSTFKSANRDRVVSPRIDAVIIYDKEKTLEPTVTINESTRYEWEPQMGTPRNNRRPSTKRNHVVRLDSKRNKEKKKKKVHKPLSPRFYNGTKVVFDPIPDIPSLEPKKKKKKEVLAIDDAPVLVDKPRKKKEDRRLSSILNLVSPKTSSKDHLNLTPPSTSRQRSYTSESLDESVDVSHPTLRATRLSQHQRCYSTYSNPSFSQSMASISASLSEHSSIPSSRSVSRLNQRSSLSLPPETPDLSRRRFSSSFVSPILHPNESFHGLGTSIGDNRSKKSIIASKLLLNQYFKTYNSNSTTPQSEYRDRKTEFLSLRKSLNNASNFPLYKTARSGDSKAPVSAVIAKDIVKFTTDEEQSKESRIAAYQEFLNPQYQTLQDRKYNIQNK